MNLGLTGGIATGKSTVVQFFKKHDVDVIDADQIAREVVEPDHPGLTEVVDVFGKEVLEADGTLNRKKLGEIIFHDYDKKKKLERILHPHIRKLMFGRMEKYQQAHPDKLIVLDIPLLYESGLEDRFDEVMVVYIPEELQLQRLQQRDQIDERRALQKIRSQMSIENKKKLADVIIFNDGTKEQTQQQVDAYLTGKRLL